MDAIWASMDECLNAVQPLPVVDDKIDEFECINCKQSGYIVKDVCTKCGFTDTINICQTAEWTGGVSEDGVASDPSRVGMASDPLYSAKWGAGTIMTVSARTRQKWSLASKIHFHNSMHHRDRALHKAYDDFDIAGRQNLALPDIIMRDAKALYKKFSEASLTRGAVRTGVKANCLFWSCKQHNSPRTTQEIATAFNISTKDVSRTFDKAREVLGPVLEPKKKSTITKPVDIVPRIFTMMGVNMDRAAQVLKMRCMRQCEELSHVPQLMGKTPTAVAVVVVYHTLLNTELETSRDSIASTTNISIATLKKIENLIKQER